MNVPPTIQDALGLDLLEPAERVAVLNDIGDLIYKGTLVRLIELMNSDQKAAFDDLMAQDASEEEVMSFLESAVPGAENAAQETADELRDDILAAMNR